MEAVTAFVLAGGKSTRMGHDKALLQLAGRALLHRAIELALTAAPEVTVVGDPAKYASFGRVVADLYPGRGPLGGIHAALANTSSDLNLILATDLPFIQPGFLKQLIAIAEASDALVTVPNIGGYFEPLCAVYRPGFGEAAERSLSKNRNKVDALFLPTITRIVAQNEILQAGFNPAMFRNLNTPGDLTQAQAEFSK